MRNVLFCVPKENQKSTRYFRSAGGTNQGLLAPSDPKEVSSKQKCWRFALPREDLLTAFLLSTDLKSLRDGCVGKVSIVPLTIEGIRKSYEPFRRL